MSDLELYRKKRRFGVTTEPEGSGRRETPDEPVFVVQKHAARRLHYDFRLEINGTLKSWAVPEGPCLDPKVRRLAVHVEDHPLDYGNFEGRIPSGEYGAGSVIVWDRGTFVSMAADPVEALAAGELKFRLVGEKLRGGWTLVRLSRDPKNWLLIKERDDEVRAIADYDVLVEAPRSVLSGLLVEDLRDAEPETPGKSADKKVARIKAARIAGAMPAEMPARVAPQLATQTDSPPEGDDWVHEIKYDGYRTICLLENGKARLFTRNQHDWTHRYGALAKAFAELDCKSAVIDGEIVVQDARGATSIASLETALSESRDSSLVYFAFDLIHLDGYDLSAARLIDRKAALAGLIGPRDPRSPIQLSEHFAGSGAELFAHVCRMGLEGIISKRIDARYEQRRTKTWTKLKRSYVSEFIVVGFTSTFPERVAALVLAEEMADGALAFVCRVSSGLTDKNAKEQFERLSALKISKPLVEAPKIPNVVWTEPAAIARIAFNSRAADGAPRQPVLLDILPYKKAARSTKPKLVADRDLAAIRLTNPERPMFGESGATKLDIALYYARVGDWMLPEILRRPLSFIRCTTGELEDCFFQRHAFAGLPPGVSTIKLSAEEGRGAFIYVESAQGFLTLTQFGAVEFHPWACRADEPEEPDRFILDLDPDVSVAWPQVRAAAELLRGRLRDLGFTPFVRTTGRKGLHLVMALAPGCKWPDLRAFAEAVSASAAKDAPQIFTNSQSMDRRKGRIYLDWIRNVRGATAIASYSLRANAELTASCPLDWDELRTLASPAAFDRKTVPKRLATLAKDPWEDLEASAVSISAKAKREVGIKN